MKPTPPNRRASARRPPRWADHLLEWFVAPHLREDVQGDLQEIFYKRVGQVGVARARREYAWAVLHYLTPFFHQRKPSEYPTPATTAMLRNYLQIAWRNLSKNKGYSAINLGGLATGMAVAMLIGLWVYDEVSYDRYHQNYDRIAQVWGGGTDPQTGKIDGAVSMNFPMGAILRNNYSHYFKRVEIAWWIGDYILSVGDKKLTKTGEFIGAGAPEMLSLKMISGTYAALSDPHSILLSKSTAEAIFGQDDPLNKSLKIDNRMDVKVTGVYEDLPKNTRFGGINFFAPWALWVASNDWIKSNENRWDNRSFPIYIELQPNVTMEAADAALHDFYYKDAPADYLKEIEKYKPFVQLLPMRTWHLYAEFKDGKPAAGRITFVWLFSIIGLFVLLIACINFMNLSTARSEKRAKEVGIRKAIGSVRRQLVIQFFSESFLVVLLAFVLALFIVLIALSWFNELADKAMTVPLTNPYFWATSTAFILLTSILSGFYPALYLSSFQPVKVLKGAFRVGRFAAIPRQVLVVVQFTVSVVLIIGTMVVYNQIQHAKNRPIGYDRAGLVTVPMNDPNYKGKYDLFKSELLRTGMVSDVALSSSPLTAVWNNSGGYTWKGKDPDKDTDFAIYNVTHDFGKTVGWTFLDGRDFSKAFATDSASIIINETAAKYIGLKNPVGQFIRYEDSPKSWQIIGVIKDMVMNSPYEPVKQTLFYLDSKYAESSQITFKIKPTVSASLALPAVEAVFKKLVPSAAFDYKFVNQEYALKFAAEERIGKLASVFAVLAIFISCLGLFGLASFLAEARTKEIGIRKVLGASVLNLWGLLSKDFVILVVIAFFIATPIAYYLLNNWLQKYEYHTDLPWWIFTLAGVGALGITLLTISFQSVKAALMNPVKSLRSE